jgi:hypothetical protein
MNNFSFKINTTKTLNFSVLTSFQVLCERTNLCALEEVSRAIEYLASTTECLQNRMFFNSAAVAVGKQNLSCDRSTLAHLYIELALP